MAEGPLDVLLRVPIGAAGHGVVRFRRHVVRFRRPGEGQPPRWTGEPEQHVCNRQPGRFRRIDAVNHCIRLQTETAVSFEFPLPKTDRFTKTGSGQSSRRLFRTSSNRVGSTGPATKSRAIIGIPFALAAAIASAVRLFCNPGSARPCDSRSRPCLRQQRRLFQAFLTFVPSCLGKPSMFIWKRKKEGERERFSPRTQRPPQVPR